MARLIQPTFNRGEISPELHGRVDTAAYVGGLATARNVHVHSYGGISRRPGTRFIGPAKDHTYAPRLIEFQFKTSDTYILEFGDEYIRFIRDDGHVLTGEVNIVGATATNPVVIDTTGVAHGFVNGDEVYIEDVGGMTELNQNRYIVEEVDSDHFNLLQQVDGTTDVDGTGFTAYTSGGTVSKIYEVTSPYAIEDVWELDYVQSADVMTIVHPSYEPRELTRTDHDAWTLNTLTLVPNIDSPTNAAAVANTTGAVSYTYVVSAIDTNTLEESYGSNAAVVANSADPPDNTISWDAVAGASEYRVYRNTQDDQSSSALVMETFGTSITDTVSDDNLDYDVRGYINRDNLFDSANEYPGAVGFYQQRRIFGGSNLDPDTSDYSRTGSFSNFSYQRPITDEDPIRATLNSQQVNQIRHYVGLNDLIIFTSGSEWRVNSGQNDTFGPNTIRQFPQSNYGCSHYQPIIIGNTIVFVTEDLGNVRSLGYNLEIDGYRGTNLNILSKHLLDGYAIADWAYHRVPDPRIYLVRSDGTALTLSYDQEQELIAWTRMDTDGDFEAVQVLRGGGSFSEDSVYWVVKRTINGNTVRYIEVMRDTFFDDPDDCFFVDSGLSYDGDPVDSVAGLSHLEGETVVALCDGLGVINLTVTNGAVELGAEYSKIHVGLPYVLEIETLNIEQGQGTIQGDRKKISSVTLRLFKSSRVRVGPNSSNVSLAVLPDGDPAGTSAALYTGDVKVHLKPSWNSNGKLYITQTSTTPLPLTLLAVVPNLDVEDN